MLAALLVGAAGQEPPRAILRPWPDSVLAPGPLTIIVKADGGELRLDGKRLQTASPARGVMTAVVEPGPGAHELVLASGVEEKIRFHVGEAGPAGWKRYRAHPPDAACESCHRADNGAWVLHGETAGPACLACHDAAGFPKSHTHRAAELEECQMCHDPHGSTEPRHLKMSKEAACKQCHG
jgi:predicted CXXCH cytochrome family protein